MSNLYAASNQWANRPDDERFETLADLHTAVSGYKASSGTAVRRLADLRVEANAGDVQLVGKAGVPAKLTHYAFGQFANRIGAPASYLRTLPPTLAAQNLNHGLARTGTGDGDLSKESQLYFHKNGSLVLRAVTGTGYTRIFDADITSRLLPLQDSGWRVPPARPARAGQKGTRVATEADVLRNRMPGLGIQVGDAIAPAGLYASDHDMFAFLVNEDRTVEVEGAALCRGIFISNSEVGDKAFRATRFLYDAVCGNHIVWGAKDVSEVWIKHVGNAPDRAFGQLRVELRKYADASEAEDRDRITAAQQTIIASSKDEVLDKLFGLKSVGLGRKVLETAYNIAESTPRYGNPKSVWGMVSGITEAAQLTPYADERVSIDRAAGKLLEVNF